MVILIYEIWDKEEFVDGPFRKVFKDSEEMYEWLKCQRGENTRWCKVINVKHF